MRRNLVMMTVEWLKSSRYLSAERTKTACDVAQMYFPTFDHQRVVLVGRDPNGSS